MYIFLCSYYILLISFEFLAGAPVTRTISPHGLIKYFWLWFWFGDVNANCRSTRYILSWQTERDKSPQPVWACAVYLSCLVAIFHAVVVINLFWVPFYTSLWLCWSVSGNSYVHIMWFLHIWNTVEVHRSDFHCAVYWLQ